MTRTEHTYYVVTACYALAAFSIAPVYPLFLLSRGLDLFQMNVVLAVFLVTVFVLEVPTGAVADRFGRKVSFLLGCLVRMTAYGLYARAQSFTDCLVAETIDALGTALASGALEAWAVDGVRAEGDRRPTDRLFARAQVATRGAMIGGGIAAAHLAEVSMVLPWVAAATAFGTTAVITATAMREVRPAARTPVTPSHPSIGRIVLTAARTVRTGPVLLLLCLLSLTAAFAGFPLHMLWQPRMRALAGGELRLMGWILAGLSLASLLGSAVLPRLLGRFGRRTVLCAAALWRAAMLGVAAATTGVSPVLAGLLLQEIAFGLTEPVLEAWTNEHVRPEERATVLSVRSAFFTFGGAVGLVCLGLVARRFGIPAAWAVSAGIFALMAPGFVLLGRLAGGPPASRTAVARAAAAG